MFVQTLCAVRLAALVALVGLSASLAAQPAPKPGAAVKPAAPAPAPVAPQAWRVPTTHPRILLNDPATKARLQESLKSGSSAASRFQTQVSGQLMGAKAYAYQPWYSALMFQLTGEVRYARHAIDETERFVLSEEDKISKNQRAAVAGDSYLEIGQQVGNVALVYDWCHEHLTPAQRERWTNYSNQAVWNVWNHTQAKWGNTVYPWTGWSVDNPSNNYYYSFLRASMLLGLATRGENPQADAWLQLFRVAKIENQLVPTFNRELTGGGSREGTGYGTAMKNLFQLYDWWYRSTGEQIAVRTPHTLASMSHLMHSIVPTLDRLAPTGDHARDSTGALFDYHREYLMVLMALFPDEPLSGVARTLLERSTVPQMKNSFMYYVDFLYEQPGIKARPLTDLATTYYGPGTGQVMMRSSWEPQATYANFICGPYTESHAHRDQGSFVIYRGAWLATDSNVFSRSGIEQDEDLHNMVRFETGGTAVKQRPGTTCSLAALADTAYYTYASARMTANYRAQPAVVQNEREFLFIKPDTFVVFDRAAANNASTRRIWTLNVGGPPTIDGDSIRYTDGKGQLDVVRLSPAGLTPTVQNWSQLRTGMQGGVRVDVADSEGSSSVFLHVLSTNGSVLSSTRADAPGQTGATIKLADGRTATVRFSTKGGAASLDLRGADQSPQVSGPLPSSVTVPGLLAR